ncbi:MAG: hypothetical protein WBB07_09630, partial [Mycobacterium sp.]
MSDQPEGRHGRSETGDDTAEQQHEPVHETPEREAEHSEYAEFHTPGYGMPALSDSPPRPLSGFRSEQRFSQPSALPPTPPATPPPPRWTPP